MSNTSPDSTRLNQGAAHDTGLYDSTVHDNQIVALYDTDGQARAAMQALIAAGFPDRTMQVLARPDAPSTDQDLPSQNGIWNSVRALFVPDSERTTYNTAIARGHAMLLVTPDASVDRTRLVHTIEHTNPLDFDAKLEEWRQAGYDAQAQPAPIHTGYVAAPDQDWRPGTRETTAGPTRVHSYITQRPANALAADQRVVQSRATGEEP